VAHHLAARRGGVVPCLRCHADGGSALPLKPPGPRNGLDCITAQAAYIVRSPILSRFDCPAAFTIILLGAASLPDRPRLGAPNGLANQGGPPISPLVISLGQPRLAPKSDAVRAAGVGLIPVGGPQPNPDRIPHVGARISPLGANIGFSIRLNSKINAVDGALEKSSLHHGARNVGVNRTIADNQMATLQSIPMPDQPFSRFAKSVQKVIAGHLPAPCFRPA
jgi:hypothetical protein